jgi:hypothetical protein
MNYAINRVRERSGAVYMYKNKKNARLIIHREIERYRDKDNKLCIISQTKYAIQHAAGRSEPSGRAFGVKEKGKRESNKLLETIEELNPRCKKLEEGK